MANEDKPRGFWPVRHLTGGEIRLSEQVVTTGQTVFEGDLIKVVAGGTVEEADADDGILVIGVAAAYVASASAGDTVLAWIDPDIVFGVQADSGTAPAATDVYASANHSAGSGNSTTGISGHELDSSDIGTGAQLKILGLLDVPGNTWGEHCELEVLISEHYMRDITGGV